MSPDLERMRRDIDAIDRAVAELLNRRASISTAIQSARVRSGGARVDLAREREVIDTYALLGPGGRDVANSVLTFCRGVIRDAVAGKREGQAIPANGVAGLAVRVPSRGV